MLVMELKITGVSALAALTLLFVMIAGCTGTAPVIPGSPDGLITQETTVHPVVTSAGTPEDARAVANANNWFAFDLYSRLAKDQKYTESNLFFSPFSLSSALAITYEGAKGKTADEIRSVFYFPDNDTSLRTGFSGMNAGINSGDPSYSLRTANALWAEETYPFLPEYVGTA